MRGNWIEMSATAAAANANPMTLTAASNLPTFADVFGTSGTRLVEYELDDGAGHYECGYGTLTLSTLSLSRDYPIATFDTGATPKYVSASATRLTTFSAAVTIRCTALASNVGPGGENFHVTGGGFGNGYTRSQTDVDYSTTLQGWRNFIAFLWTGSRPITSLSIYVNTVATAGSLRVGIMEISGPGSYNLIKEFTAATLFDLTLSGKQTLTNFTPIFLPPGPYVLQFVQVSVTGSPKLQGAQNNISNACGMFGRGSSNRVQNCFLDAAGATTLATSFSGTPGGGYAIYNALPDFVFGTS